MDYFGYAGNILRINLTSGEIKKEPLDPKGFNRLLSNKAPEQRGR